MRPSQALHLTSALLVVVCALSWAGENAQSEVSPAEQKIAQARRAIAANPNDYQAHNALALALARRARETGDPAFYDHAEAAIRDASRLMPDNLDSEKLSIWVLLGKHDFAKALDRARALNKKVPDDVLVYGFITDACVELGYYEEAEKAAQWMLDLRAGNVPGLTRAAYLRELFGDIEGALEFMHMSYQRTPPQETEDRAWMLNHIGHLHLMRGKVEEAEAAIQQALAVYPAYHYALAQLAKVRTAQQRYSEAVSLLKQLYGLAPYPENLFELAKTLEKAGRAKDARKTFAEFEKKATAEMHNVDNANRELIFYYADHARKPSEALRVARLEAARRKDVYTLDAYSWALFANGAYGEARKQIEKALKVGVRDAVLFYHAGAIALEMGDRTAARGYLRNSVELNPFSEVSGAARKLLVRLKRNR
ncbi:MAG: tetratricopeptide repeat protein [Deltaproteobacteria bacterium]|nr:tetratricopeptide repeat protein [Deltaproteobacteria bacterium]